MSTETKTYRHVPDELRICRFCDQEVRPLAPRGSEIRMPLRARVHKANGSHCPGSHEEVLGWLEASRLPGWDDLTDLDKGAALMHVWKRHREGGPYATEHYPARYFDHSELVQLDERTASRHAACVAGRWVEAVERLGGGEVQRLYDLALDADRQRAESEASRG